MEYNDIELYYGKCMEFIRQIKNPVLKECCQVIYMDFKEKLINKPATTGSHHFFRGITLSYLLCNEKCYYDL